MKVIVPTVGSEISRRAIQFGALVAADMEGSVTLVSVIRGEEDLATATARLEHLRREATRWLAPERIDTKVRVGHPAEQILSEAEAGDYDLMAVGDRQHGGVISRFLLGSTAQRLVEHSPCPVVIAKGHISVVRRILILDSGVADSPLVERVIAELPALVHRADSVAILHVMSQMAAGPTVAASDVVADIGELIAARAPEGELLARDREVLAAFGIEPELRVRHGLVVEEALAEADEGAYDLVAIGAHRGTGWRRLILGDLAQQIMASMPVPVLILPHRPALSTAA
jgi:nucleotide-binding universal stress UspA family protein